MKKFLLVWPVVTGALLYLLWPLTGLTVLFIYVCLGLMLWYELAKRFPKIGVFIFFFFLGLRR